MLSCLRAQPTPRSRRRRFVRPSLEDLEMRLAPAATQLVVISPPPTTVIAGQASG